MNLFNFIVTRQLVINKTNDAARANKLGLLTSFVPGTWGMMMGVLLADREGEVSVRPSDGEVPNGEVPKEPRSVGRTLPAGKSGAHVS